MSAKQIAVLTVLSSVLLLVVCTFFLLLTVSQPAKGDNLPATAVAIMQDKPLEMSVVGWEFIASDRFFIAPQEGFQVVSVEVVFTNNSRANYDVYPNIFFLKDNEGRLYGWDMTSSAELNNGVAGIGGTLVPGDLLRGKLAFQIPKNVQPAGLRLIYEEPAGNDLMVNLK